MSSEADRLNAITNQIIGAAIDVHRELGPGMLESSYEACLMYELLQRSLRVDRQKPASIVYKNQTLDCGYRIDLLVENEVIIELKAVETILPVHEAQLLSYLRLTNKSVGLLINFHVDVLKSGIRRKTRQVIQKENAVLCGPL